MEVARSGCLIHPLGAALGLAHPEWPCYRLARTHYRNVGAIVLLSCERVMLRLPLGRRFPGYPDRRAQRMPVGHDRTQLRLGMGLVLLVEELPWGLGQGWATHRRQRLRLGT